MSGTKVHPASHALFNDGRPRRRRRESGHVLITTTLALVVLIAFVGLAVDVGYLDHVKRRMQTAADAGALAGARDILRGRQDGTYAPDPVAKAKADAALNGFADGSDGILVNVEYPYNGLGIRVTISQPRPMFFIKVLPVTQATVVARAAANLVDGNGCLIALYSGSTKAGLTVNGTTNANLTNCSIYVDASGSAPHEAIVGNGGGQVSATSISGYGTWNGNGDFTPPPASGMLPIPDPLAGTVRVTPDTCAGIPGCSTTIQSATPRTVASNETLDPGVFCGGMTFSGSNIHLNPGVYVISGGGSNGSLISTTSTITVNGTGVTFYITAGWGGSNPCPTTPAGAYSYGDVKINGGTLDLSAPTSGPLKGILFYQDPSATTSGSNIINGNENSHLDGVLYFPTTDLTFGGNAGTDTGNPCSGSDCPNAVIIAQKVTLTGTAQFNYNGADLPNALLVSNVALTE